MSETRFHALRRQDSVYEVQFKKQYKPDGKFKYSTVESALNFAFKMTYGKQGEHRNYRSGGTERRGLLQIFSDTFQGKLSEFAFSNFLFPFFGLIEPDLETYQLGKWDLADFEVNSKSYAIKSTKYYGNLLLLETKDWNSKGEYLQGYKGPKSYDAIILIRISPDIHNVLSEIIPGEALDSKILFNKINQFEWKYEFTGFINSQDLAQIIMEGLIIPKGAFLSARTRMDAENYYVQSGDLRNLSELITN